MNLFNKSKNIKEGLVFTPALFQFKKESSFDK